MRARDVERVLALSDAAFGIVATVLVVPLHVSPEDIGPWSALTRSQFFHELIVGKLAEYLLFFLSVVYTMLYWLSHAKLFAPIERVSRLEWTLNLIVIMLVCLVPLTSSFAHEDPSAHRLPAAIYSGHMFVVIVGQFVLFLLAEGYSDPTVRKLVTIEYLVRAGIPAAILIILFFPSASAAWALPLLSSQFASRIITRVVAKRMGLLKEYKARKKVPLIPLARFNQLADAIFSIAATLLILEIRVPAEWPSGGPEEVVRAQLPEIAAFFMSYYLITIQLYSSVCDVTRHAAPMQNTKFGIAGGGLLAIIAFLPYSVSVMLRFPHQPYAQLFFAAVLFLAGLGPAALRVATKMVHAPQHGAADGETPLLSSAGPARPGGSTGAGSVNPGHSGTVDASPAAAGANPWPSRRGWVIPCVSVLIAILAVPAPEACRFVIILVPIAITVMDIQEHRVEVRSAKDVSLSTPLGAPMMSRARPQDQEEE